MLRNTPVIKLGYFVNKLVVVVLLAIAGNTAQRSHGQSISGPVINPSNGHRYYLLEENN